MSPTEVKSIRESIGLTQAALARRLRVRQATVSDWETGTVVPSGLARAALAALATQRTRSTREAFAAMEAEQLADFEDYKRRCGGVPVSHNKP